MYMSVQCMLIVLSQGAKEISRMSIVAVPINPTMEFMFGKETTPPIVIALYNRMYIRLADHKGHV